MATRNGQTSPLGPNSGAVCSCTSSPHQRPAARLPLSVLSHGGLGILAQGFPCAQSAREGRLGHILSVMVKGPGKSAGVHRHRQSQGLLDKPALTTGFILPAKGDVYGSASARTFRSSAKGPFHPDALCRSKLCNPNSCCVPCTAEVHGTGAARGVVLGLWLLERTSPHKSLQRKTGHDKQQRRN